jgi:hypothetical protein
MSILRFRVTFEDFDDIHRDIDLKDDHTFADLFNTLLQSVQFDTKHAGVFFLADHNWRKGEMIGEILSGEESKLSKTELIAFIDDPHQKFLFTYDREARWNFTIELIRLMGSPEYRAEYPKVAASAGAPPVQYKESLIIPVRERTEPDGRGRKKRKIEDEHDGLAFIGNEEEDEILEEGEIADSAPEELSLDLPADLDLETDTEIAKLAEEFNNTTEIDEGNSGAADDEELGFANDDDELDNQDEDDYGSAYGSRDEYEE